MRVIAGRAKGHHLKAPKGAPTRPTADKVRGAIFAMVESLLVRAIADGGDEIAAAWDGARVLDLYAGTGALGIEALSRGAKSADFVEANPSACQAIRDNLTHTKLAPQARVHCVPVQRYLERWGSGQRADDSYDVVLMDPPYQAPGIDVVLNLLGVTKMIKDEGLLVVEHSCRRALLSVVPGLTLIKDRQHGDTIVSIYARQGSTTIADVRREESKDEQGGSS